MVETEGFETDHPHTFNELGIHRGIVDALSRENITTPTPIQHQVIPSALEGKDIIGVAQTGTGKTYAFGIPTLQRLAQYGGKGLVMVPTRELAFQARETLKVIARELHIRMVALIGGMPIDVQRTLLNDPYARLLLATPGRLIEHLRKKTLTLLDVRILVFDEADRLMDKGFKPDVDKILQYVPKKRQTMLFSATMPNEVVELAASELRDPLRIEAAPSGTPAEKVVQELFVMDHQKKFSLLERLLEEHSGQVLVFCGTKRRTEKIARTLRSDGHEAADIHKDCDQSYRTRVLKEFKSGDVRILVATDIAARGIDIDDIALVINFDLPTDLEDYVHRIGRTARAGRGGRAITFATPEEADQQIPKIEQLMGMPIPRSGLQEMETQQ